MTKRTKVAPRVSKGSDKDLEQGLLEDVEVPKTYATVTVSYSLTVNLGNYESARVMVGVDMPCDPAKVANTYESTSELVKNLLAEEVSGMKGKAAKLGEDGW